MTICIWRRYHHYSYPLSSSTSSLRILNMILISNCYIGIVRPFYYWLCMNRRVQRGCNSHYYYLVAALFTPSPMSISWDGCYCCCCSIICTLLCRFNQILMYAYSLWLYRDWMIIIVMNNYVPTPISLVAVRTINTHAR